MTRASAPGRAGIIGNPSDLYGGVVVSCSVPLRAVCTLREADDWTLPEDTRLWDAATKRFPLVRPYRVEWTTDIPRSSGISGSTALLAATLLCVLAVRGEAPSLETIEERTSFAELVRDVERFDAEVVCGYQDAQMIVHGGLQQMSFAGKHPVEPGPPPSLEGLDSPLPFLLATTGVERLSGSVHGPMSQRWMNGDAEVRAVISRIAELGLEGAQALRAQDWATLGSLMNENQALIASVGGSGDAVDALVAACFDGGAMGAKLAGAGLGGTVIALSQDLDALEHHLREQGYARITRLARVPGARLEEAI